jgi:hypothetical protein
MQTDVLGAVDRSLAYAHNLTGSKLFVMSKWGRDYPEYLECDNHYEDYKCELTFSSGSGEDELHTYGIRGRAFAGEGDPDDRGGRDYTRQTGVLAVSALGLGGALLYAMLLTDGPLPLRRRSRNTGPVPRKDTFDQHRRRGASPSARATSRSTKTDHKPPSPSPERTAHTASSLATSSPVSARRRQSPARVPTPRPGSESAR